LILTNKAKIIILASQPPAIPIPRVSVFRIKNIMTMVASNPVPTTAGRASTVMRKVMREVARPFRRLANRRIDSEAIARFHPQQATVEPEGIPLIQKLVRESRQYTGPIIEIGTLLGVTTTSMALCKAPEQKIITVDLYCWNPWKLPAENHRALASTVLHFLVQTGQVEQVVMDKNEFMRTYQGPPPAMVFLDAIHTYEETKLDIQWAQRVGAKIISGHDYCDKFLGVKQVVDEFGGPRELAASVWVL
jgi:Methyltransferase domain